jgi:hypothetical protein
MTQKTAIPVQLTDVGDGVGFLLPDKVAEHLGAKSGEILKFSKTADGFLLSRKQIGRTVRNSAGRGNRRPTIEPGYTNKNGQTVVSSTGLDSVSFPGQKIYRLHCSKCELEYGANGCDIHIRRCPSCQKGRAGEQLPSPSTSLFHS